jgi:DNA-binding SARP family transcriptional activator
LRNRQHRGAAPVITNDRSASKLAIELFETGRYDQLGEIVHPPEPGGDPRAAYTVTLWIRDMVGWLCEARTHDEVEATLHHEALARIASRHEEQKQTLGAIFDLIDRTHSGSGNAAAGQPPEVTPGTRSPSLDIYCLGQFHVWFAGRPVENWNGGKGRSILKFLAASSDHRAEREVLMELLWPDAEPHSARNNLNVAVHGLRQTLSEIDDFPVVLFRDDGYLLNPHLEMWVDLEAFADNLRTAQNLEERGEIDAAIREYRRAESLYRGEFMAEDRYEDWPELQRRSLRDQFVTLLDRLGRYWFDREDYGSCVQVYRKMNAVDPCEEEPHRRLMVCWSRLGLTHLAQEQYLECRRTLARHLESGPSSVTDELLHRIQQRQPV